MSISAVLWDDRSILKDRASIPILIGTSFYNIYNILIFVSVEVENVLLTCGVQFTGTSFYNIYNILIFVSVEAENDLLTCGKCQQEFYLCDINSFIKHKISLCSKNSLHCHSPPPRNHDDQPPPVTTPTKPPDGDQLPIHKEHKEQKVPGLNFQALFSSKDSLEKIIRDELARTGNSHSKKKEVEKVDAETITVYSGESEYTMYNI